MSLSPRFLTYSAIFAISGLVACGDDMDTEQVKFQVTIENVSASYDFLSSGVAAVPMGDTEPGALLPDNRYEFSFAAAPGSALSFASMFVHSNDLFYAPDEMGIPLYSEDGTPLDGDVTDQILLWDAGTEANQEPGSGSNQPPRQGPANTGPADPTNTVRIAEDTFENLPDVDEAIEVMLRYDGAGVFTLTIENVSTATTLQHEGGSSAVLLTPVVWVVHTEDEPLFTPGESQDGSGLEALAEDGNPQPLADSLASRTGLVSPIAPGVYAVHGSGAVLFSEGQADAENGLEALAEDGDPSGLSDALSTADGVIMSGVFNTVVGGGAPAPAFPGEAYRFEVTAESGDRLSLATMLVQTNDLFFAFDPSGIALFDASGMPISQDVTVAISLWDAGTEVNEAPGAGKGQAPRQTADNPGTTESGTVRLVDDGFEYPAPSEVIRVTIKPLAE